MKMHIRIAMLFLVAALGIQAQALQEMDADFATLVKQWTTRPEFINPLVDHLPKKGGIPTPKDILGYHVGAPQKLTYTADQQRFFKELEKALPGRVRTMVLGKSE